MAGKSYSVIAPLVLLDGADASSGSRELYRGTPVPDGVSSEWLERHLADGMIGSEDELVAQPAGDATPTPAKAAPRKRTAKKAAARKAPAKKTPAKAAAPAVSPPSTATPAAL